MNEVIDEIKAKTNRNDIILIHGGGFLGTLWMGQELHVRKIIETFPNNKIIILPQTIFYGEDEESKRQFELSKKIYGKHKDLHIFAREEISYNIINF